MSDMRDDLLATLGAAQEGADLPALADNFCQRWEKQTRTERRITPPPWGGWFEFFGWAWVTLGSAALGLAIFIGNAHAKTQPVIPMAVDFALWFAMGVFFLKWFGLMPDEW